MRTLMRIVVLLGLTGIAVCNPGVGDWVASGRDTVSGIGAGLGSWASSLSSIGAQFQGISDQIQDARQNATSQAAAMCNLVDRMNRYQAPLQKLAYVMPAVGALNGVLGQMSNACGLVADDNTAIVNMNGKTCKCKSPKKH